MAIPTNITIRHIEKTPAIEQDIRERLNKMSQFFDRIESCKIVVGKSQNKQTHGKLFNVFIQVLVPGKTLIVNRQGNENLYIALRDSFAAMTKQVKGYAHKINGGTKVHQPLMTGCIERLYDDYGFIEASDGSEYYFKRDNVLHADFNKLKEGTVVRFLEAEIGDSPQAGHVCWLVDDEGEEFKKAA